MYSLIIERLLSRLLINYLFLSESFVSTSAPFDEQSHDIDVPLDRSTDWEGWEGERET